MGGRGRVDLPVDRELGLCGGFSLGTVAAIAQLCAMLAPWQWLAPLCRVSRVDAEARSTLRMVDAVGAEARGLLAAAAAALPEDDGEVLVSQVDGRGAPMITATEAERCRQCSGSSTAS